ncbi:putative transcriptional regulatory protein TcrX [Rosistilla carotiformis]|uniref:Putative transcriptional regulatory protein TcrX n=1 Tax=Rosistilla carotiformis TaxID=2528017 RepID=A0A518JSJ1_9BACT|nr:response regulator [Rosistilla carotiformis]QDV68513.1 putative transcriptional regulatory protein TcrX [Rosistilla carotiformis]
MANILLAEDSPTQVVLLKSLLEEESHRVRVAGDGQVAMAMVAQQVPDVVVTDMQMPNMDGLELVKNLRHGYPQVPVILITAQDCDDLAVRALKEGAAAYLPKSRVDEELLESVAHVLSLLDTEMSYKNLIDCLDYYEFQFTLENDPKLIAPLVNLMQQMAAGIQYCDDVTRARIGMALEQALRNALYHGNLELSHDELVRDEELKVAGEPTLVDRRRSETPFNDRRIHFRAKLGHEMLQFTVRDDGPGFDCSAVQSPEHNGLDATGGRGLVLIQSFMDEIRFNDRGNEIKLISRVMEAAEV